MMREVLGRRFKRLIAEAPRPAVLAELAALAGAETSEPALPQEEIEILDLILRPTIWNHPGRISC